jgi:hypothetical protein
VPLTLLPVLIRLAESSCFNKPNTFSYNYFLTWALTSFGQLRKVWYREFFIIFINFFLAA